MFDFFFCSKKKVIISPLREKIPFNLIMKIENRYKQTKMTEIKLYIYKVIEIDKMRGD